MKHRFLAVIVFAFLYLFAAPQAHAQGNSGMPSFEEAMAAFNYGDNELASRYFMRLANEGDARAQYFLAYMMDAGLGMGKDLINASTWYEKSAKQDYLPAMVYMGYILSAAHGVARNDKKAFGWYTRAAQMGDAIAQNNLATMLRNGKPYTKDLKLAAQWFLQSAMQGNMRAQYNLATMYRKGDGIRVNMSEAMRWFTYAANQGDMYAQNALGYMYYKGEGVEKQDRAMALEWYRRAAEQGHKPSQMALARMYERGDANDGKPDYENAAIWYFHAADKGDENAMYALGRLYLRPTDENSHSLVRDPKAACDWYRKAAEEKNHLPSMVKLGKCYETGEGMRKPDLGKAGTWYRRAADAGEPEAMLEMANMFEKGIGMDKSPIQAYRWYLLAQKQSAGSPDASEAMAAAVRARTTIGMALSPQDRQSVQLEAESWRPFVAPVYGGQQPADGDRSLSYDE